MSRAHCDCYGCWFAGQGTCGCFRCSECMAESDVLLETLDVAEDEDCRQRAYRPCPECAQAVAA